MKAHTFFALSIAVLVALGAAVAAKMAGLFEKPAAPAQPVVEEVPIVVAQMNLYQGYGINSQMVTTTTIPKDSELYRSVQGKVLTNPAAAFDRVPQRNILAGEPILNSDLSEQALPETPQAPEGMVAVNVDVAKENALGGMIRRGQKVDVMLTTNIHPPGEPELGDVKSAIIARNVQVLTLRNRLIDVLEKDEPGKPIPFTLAASPYRAALIEQAKLKGTLSFLVPADEQAAPNPDDAAKSQAIRDGKLVISDADFNEIFQVEEPPAPEPPPTPEPPQVEPPPPPPPPLHVTRHFVGVDQTTTNYFNQAGERQSEDERIENALRRIQAANPPVPAVASTPPAISAIAPEPEQDAPYRVFSIPKQ